MTADDTAGSIETCLRVFLHEPRPTRFCHSMSLRAGAIPAEMGFVAAVDRVVDNDHALAVEDWASRQQRVRGWVARIAKIAPDTAEKAVEEAALAGDSARLTSVIGLALTGAPNWAEIMDDLEEMAWWAELRAAESAQKHRAIADCLRRLANFAEGVELATATARSLATLDAIGSAVDAETRRVLDLDEALSALTVAEWNQLQELRN